MAGQGTRQGGVVAMILQMSKESTDFYKGQTTWLVMSLLYLSFIYLAETPWFSRKNDFQCHGNISEACLAECYNDHFSIPVIGIWNVTGLTVYSIFFMMEFSVFHNLSKNISYPQQPSEEGPSNTPAYHKSDAKRKETIVSLATEKLLLSAFLVYYLVQLSIKGGLIIIMWFYQQPMVKEDIWCHTAECQGPYLCVLMAKQEKLMGIVLMTVLSVIIITFCIIFFLYTISLYALTSVILRDTQTKFQQQSR